jgi:hypothetical protein
LRDFEPADGGVVPGASAGDRRFQDHTAIAQQVSTLLLQIDFDGIGGSRGIQRAEGEKENEEANGSAHERFV